MQNPVALEMSWKLSEFIGDHCCSPALGKMRVEKSIAGITLSLPELRLAYSNSVNVINSVCKLTLLHFKYRYRECRRVDLQALMITGEWCNID